MSDRDLIEAHTLYRRRVLAAFLWGRDRAARSAHTNAGHSLLLGLGVALLIAVVVGVVAVVDGSRHRQAEPIAPQAALSTAAS